MVDSNDRERVSEAKDELNRMLNEDELREAILLVFANKQVSGINNRGLSQRPFFWSFGRAVSKMDRQIFGEDKKIIRPNCC